MKFEALFYGGDGTFIANAKTYEKELDKGVHAVYVDDECDFELDPYKGVVCSIAPDAETDGFVSVHRHTEFWCKPVFGSSLSEVPSETQTLVLKLKDGGYTVILPPVSEEYCSVLMWDEIKGSLAARLFTQCKQLKKCKALAFVYKTGDNPYVLMKELFEQAVNALGTGVKMREERAYPEIFEYLGWCSWDALQIRVNEKDLVKKCEEFKEKNIPVRWAIIDDMWGEVPNFRKHTYDCRRDMFKLMHSSRLADFEAAYDRFPDGLAHAIAEMKKYLTWVGMWHPTTGYWMGIEEDSKLYEQFKEHLFKTHDGRWIPKPEHDSFYAYWNAFHSFLEECGTDFVKVDFQSLIRMFYMNTRPIGTIARELHTALEKSTTEHFGNKLINCMGCANDNIMNRPQSPVSRCSDDFQPENRDWFTKHILQCSFMSYMQGPIITCDWDMWWTDDGQAIKNSVIRAISGGPIYVSDEIGRSNREILMPLCLDDGRILRCDRPAMPTLDCMFNDPETSGKIFKVQNKCGESGAIAAFNLMKDETAASGYISPADIEGLCGEEFAVYEHFAGKFYVMKKDERMEVTFRDRDDFRLYTFTPIKDDFAAIGRTDKFMSPLTVKSVKNGVIELIEDGPYAYYSNGKFTQA